jgi:hypothetical protein
MRKSIPAKPTEPRQYSVSLQQTAAALFDPVGQQGGAAPSENPRIAAVAERGRKSDRGQMG